MRRLETVEARAAPVCGPACTGGRTRLGGPNRRARPRPLAPEPQPGAELRAARRLFPITRLALPGGAAKRLTSPNRRVRTRMHGGVTGEAGDRPPMSIVRRLTSLES